MVIVFFGMVLCTLIVAVFAQAAIIRDKNYTIKSLGYERARLQSDLARIEGAAAIKDGESAWAKMLKPRLDDTCPECGNQFDVQDDYICLACRAKVDA